ncbi:hypothetical protein HMPREF1314_1871 [Bifidobacterium longum subsp. longum 35B]|nr:hypothetical protein HMPREF1314_1871 [Bifidobacterium longum subsp. longum 35B]
MVPPSNGLVVFNAGSVGVPVVGVPLTTTSFALSTDCEPFA